VSFPADLRERLHELSKHFPGFEEVLIQTLFALVTGEHQLWYSKPGRAKSMVAKAIVDLFGDASLFSIQCRADMKPEELLGTVIVDDLMKGHELYNLDNGIVKCDFAFLDEFMDAMSSTLRGALLMVLNEREFRSKDMGIVPAKLHMAIATSNYMRANEANEAVLDRFMCKAVLKGIEDVTDCMRAGETYLGYEGKRIPLPKLAYADLVQLSELVQSPDGITISPGMRLLHVLLIQEFQRRRLSAAATKWQAANSNAVDPPDAADLQVPEISPRTMVKLHDFSRAAAALNERDKVTAPDLRALGYGLYVVGDDSGDDVIWHLLCDEWLDLNRKELSSLEHLGELADAVGTIKAEKSQVSGMELRIGGQLVEFTAIEARTMLDGLNGVNHPAVNQAKEELRKEIDVLADKPEHGRFDLLKGWE
jgi:MoxR-like ATPase